MAVQAPSPATEKQVAFLTKLLGERVVDDEHAHYLFSAMEDNALTKHGASTEIESLLSKPKKAAPEAPGGKSAANKEAHPGYYTDGERYFEVVVSKSSGNKYAKVLEVQMPECEGHESLRGDLMGAEFYCDGSCKKAGKAKWVYRPGLMKNFQSWTPVSMEQAAAFGKQFGNCFVCGRLLTKAESVEAGIGPICAGKF